MNFMQRSYRNAQTAKNREALALAYAEAEKKSGTDITSGLYPPPKSKEGPPYEIGQYVEHEGIYFGIWDALDRNGNPQGKKFYLFAAPTNLQNACGKDLLITYDEAVYEISKMRNWHGYYGAKFSKETDLYEAIEKNRYYGEWFIPPRMMIDGKNHLGETVLEDNLYAHKNTGRFANSLFPSDKSKYGNINWYWTSSEHNDLRGHIWAIQFPDDIDGASSKDGDQFLCRPIRLEPVF